MRVAELGTPALLVDLVAFEHNVATMAARWPGRTLRPHVKAFKSTALAARLAAAGHPGFCTATVKETAGLAAAGLGEDLLLANEVPHADRLAPLGELVRRDRARVTIAVDSSQTIEAAARAGLREVLVDVNVGLPRCGCPPGEAARIAELARAAGLEVRGTMGYEGHLVGVEDRVERTAGTSQATTLLAAAHAAVGGEICSGGGTGTWDLNTTVTELQAGSYVLMDTAYERLDLPFRLGVAVLGTVVSRSTDGYAVADVGLKALGMDHGNPTIEGADIWFCSDEHVTFSMRDRAAQPQVADRVLVWPAHLDPTLALHERLHVIDSLGTLDVGTEVLDVWPIDLRNW